MARPTPFELVFGHPTASAMTRVRDSLEAAGRDPWDRDAFLLDREVVTLIRELRPDGGVGEAIDQLAAFLHHAYLVWREGQHVVGLARDAARALLAGEAEPAAGAPPPAYYIQFPERLVWAQVVDGHPHEPLDGLSVLSGRRLRVLGVFGLAPQRMGMSLVEAEGPRPVGLARPDGTPLFAPVLPGGAAAGLHSITGVEELLELGARTMSHAARALAA